MLEAEVGASTPAWLKMTPRLDKTPRAVGTPPLTVRPLGDLTAAAANSAANSPAAAEATPEWLKRASCVQQAVSAGQDSSSSCMRDTPIKDQVAVVVSKSKGIKIGAIKVQQSDLASLRADLQNELPQLRSFFPKGFLFALPEGDIPVGRNQERSWSVEDVASVASGGRLTLTLMDNPAPASRGAALYQQLCVFSRQTVVRAATAKAQVAKQWQQQFKVKPMSKLLACGPAFLASGAATTATKVKALRVEAEAATPMTLALTRTTSSTRSPVAMNNVM